MSQINPEVAVQSLSRVWLFVTPWTAARQASLFFTISQSLLQLMSIESEMPSNHLILHRFLLLLPPIFPSIRVFSNESALRIRWPHYWHFSVSISPSSEYSWLISFTMDWLDLLAVQGTLKSLLQHHGSEASILRHSALQQDMVAITHGAATGFHDAGPKATRDWPQNTLHLDFTPWEGGTTKRALMLLSAFCPLHTVLDTLSYSLNPHHNRRWTVLPPFFRWINSLHS